MGSKSAIKARLRFAYGLRLAAHPRACTFAPHGQALNRFQSATRLKSARPGLPRSQRMSKAEYARRIRGLIRSFIHSIGS